MPASPLSASSKGTTAPSAAEAMQAMILAAGFGTRLLPHTLLRPKPLFPILKQPLLLLTIRHLQRVGCDHIIVNCHHLGRQVSDLLAGIAGVTVLPEETILGTGGGLRGALPLLRDEPLLISNGDIYHSFDLRLLYDRHAAAGSTVSLAMHDYPRFNTVRVEDGRVREFAGTTERDCKAFTGIHVLNPEILEGIAPHRYSCILDRYRQLLAAGVGIAAVEVKGYWTDMGTPEDYLGLHGGLLTGAVPRWPEMGELAGAPFLLERGSAVPTDLHCEDWCCLGDVEIGRDVRLTRVVAWDGVRIAGGSRLSDVLLSA